MTRNARCDQQPPTELGDGSTWALNTSKSGLARERERVAERHGQQSIVRERERQGVKERESWWQVKWARRSAARADVLSLPGLASPPFVLPHFALPRCLLLSRSRRVVTQPFGLQHGVRTGSLGAALSLGLLRSALRSLSVLCSPSLLTVSPVLVFNYVC